jgi:hypothetical protein
MPVLITQQRSLRCQVLLGRYLLYRFVEILPLQHTVALSQRFLIETLLMMTILFCKIIYAQHTNPIIFKPCLSRLLYWLLLPANGVDTQPLQLAPNYLIILVFVCWVYVSGRTRIHWLGCCILVEKCKVYRLTEIVLLGIFFPLSEVIRLDLILQLLG